MRQSDQRDVKTLKSSAAHDSEPKAALVAELTAELQREILWFRLINTETRWVLDALSQQVGSGSPSASSG